MVKQKTSVNVKALIALAIVIMLVVAGLGAYTYIDTKAKLNAQWDIYNESFSKLKDYEMSLEEKTDVSFSMKFIDFADAVVVQVMVYDNAFLPTNYQYNRWDGSKYKEKVRVYHVLKKGTSDKLSYYGYIFEGQWYGKKSWFMDSNKWHTDNTFFKSDNVYINSFKYIYSGKVNGINGEPLSADWSMNQADFVVTLNNTSDASAVKLMSDVYKNISISPVSSGSMKINNTYFVASRGFIEKGNSHAVNPNLTLKYNYSNYTTDSYFDKTINGIVSFINSIDVTKGDK